MRDAATIDDDCGNAQVKTSGRGPGGASASAAALLALALFSACARTESTRATPVPAPPSSFPSPKPMHSLPTAPHDRVRDLAGVWACRGKGASRSTMTFTRAAKDTLVLDDAAAARSERTTMREVYRFDTVHQRWTLAAPAERFAGDAGPWSGTAWVIEGPAPTHGTKRSRLTYTLDDRGGFSRAFQISSGAQWRTTSVETCARLR